MSFPLAPSRRRAGLLLAGVALSGLMSACAPLVVGGAAVGSALVAVDRRTSGAQLDDQGIELRASNRIKEQFGERANVSVTSYNRQVLLTGEAASEAVKAEVERVVAGVDNVRSIVNELGVVNSPSFSQRSSDTLITGKVKAGMVDATCGGAGRSWPADRAAGRVRPERTAFACPRVRSGHRCAG